MEQEYDDRTTILPGQFCAVLRVILIPRDEVSDGREDVEPDLLPLSELDSEYPGETLEAGGEVGGGDAEAREQGPHLVGQHRVGLLAHAVLGGAALDRPGGEMLQE